MIQGKGSPLIPVLIVLAERILWRRQFFPLIYVDNSINLEFIVPVKTMFGHAGRLTLRAAWQPFARTTQPLAAAAMDIYPVQLKRSQQRSVFFPALHQCRFASTKVSFSSSFLFLGVPLFLFMLEGCHASMLRIQHVMQTRCAVKRA